MAKKIVLNVDYEHTFLAIGICSPQKDYRLCWLLNKNLETDLRKIRDFSYTPPGSRENLGFTVYRYLNERKRMDYSLVSNRSSGYMLFSEPKNLDYLFLVRNPSDQFTPIGLLTMIRKTPFVQAAFMVDGKLGKQENAFFFDFELFLSQKKT
jgi:hypothetical protein